MGTRHWPDDADERCEELEQKNEQLRKQLAKANERVKELELIVVAITHADETGYVDDVGFVEGWSEVCDETKQLLNKFALEKQASEFERYASMCEAFCTTPSVEALREHAKQLRKEQS